MSNVLVTGGAGYVGSHICKALSAADHTPVVYDNFSRGHRGFVRWGPAVEGEITDAKALTAALCDHAIDAVIHCAALAYVAESEQRPLDYYNTNVIGSVSALEAMREAGVEHFVLSSSCAVYGTPDSAPITEDARMAPISPYGRTKWMVESMAAECARAYGFRCVSLRYFNAAGADPDGEIGERHDPETHLIPNALMAAADSRRALEIYGTDYDTPDGTAVRDYLHVMDLADAHVQALEYTKSAEGHTAFNLGAGRGASVRDVIEGVRRVTGKDLATTDSPRRPGDPACLVADAQKAMTVMDWRPVRSDIETIIADAWAYMTS